jgi:hypothetical protein
MSSDNDERSSDHRKGRSRNAVEAPALIALNRATSSMCERLTNYIEY